MTAADNDWHWLELANRLIALTEVLERRFDRDAQPPIDKSARVIESTRLFLMRVDTLIQRLITTYEAELDASTVERLGTAEQQVSALAECLTGLPEALNRLSGDPQWTGHAVSDY